MLTPKVTDPENRITSFEVSEVYKEAIFLQYFQKGILLHDDKIYIHDLGRSLSLIDSSQFRE